MSWLEIILAVTTAIGGITTAIQSARLDILHRCASRVADTASIYRDALSYISHGKGYPFDDKFAEAVLDGNDIALRQSFDSFERFRSTIDQHWEQTHG